MNWSNRKLVTLVVAGLVVLCVQSAPVAAVSLKLATLIPEGSIWDKALREMGDQWKRDTEGRVSLRIYAGGVAGNESDILRKMRIGQLHAAALTVAGLEDIDPAFGVLSMPLFYESFDEYLYVLDGLSSELRAKLEAKDYVLLHWGHGGWVRFFSREPIRGMDDLRRQKIFVTAGADRMFAIWKDNGFKPVALAPTDIMTGFQTGMIDVLATPPLAALSLQWFRQAKFMQASGLAPLSGATVVARSAWDRIDEADRKKLLEDAEAYEKRQRAEIPEQEQIAIDEMVKRGLTVTPADESAEWQTTATRLAESMRGSLVPREFYDMAVKLRDEFRSRSSLARPLREPARSSGPEAEPDAAGRRAAGEAGF